MAAVIGRDFDFDLLDAVTEPDEEDVLDILDAASAIALVREVPDVPGRYSFSHALTQHTLYRGLPTIRRARAHQRVAGAIEVIVSRMPGRRVGELAHHSFNASQPANAGKALESVRRGATPLWPPWPQTMRSGISPRHSDWQKQCPRTTPWSAVTCAWPLARQNVRLGYRASARPFSTPHTELKSFIQRIAWSPPHSGTAAASSAQSASLTSKRSQCSSRHSMPCAMTMAASGRSSWPRLQRARLGYDFGPAAGVGRRRQGDGEASGGSYTIIRTLHLVCNPLQVPSTLNERIVDAKEALELSEVLGDPDLLFWTSADGRLAGVQAGDFEMARRCLTTMRAVIKGLRQPTMIWVTLFNDAADALWPAITNEPNSSPRLRWRLARRADNRMPSGSTGPR